MLGTILLYVGMVLISNGVYAVEGIKDKSIVVMNFFTGGLRSEEHTSELQSRI